MSTHSRVSHPIHGLLPMEVEAFDSPAELALDLRWSWNHATDHVWRQLDPVLWDLTQGSFGPLSSRPRLPRRLDGPPGLVAR